ncbi:YjcZ family sporulation protein [Peribacillus sp. NPDC096540]
MSGFGRDGCCDGFDGGRGFGGGFALLIVLFILLIIIGASFCGGFC